MFEEMERAGYGAAAAAMGGVVLSRDPKPRLRWTPDLHERFVEAVTKLGGPDSEYLPRCTRLLQTKSIPLNGDANQ
jgi:hypothetical protein